MILFKTSYKKISLKGKLVISLKVILMLFSKKSRMLSNVRSRVQIHHVQLIFAPFAPDGQAVPSDKSYFKSQKCFSEAELWDMHARITVEELQEAV